MNRPPVQDAWPRLAAAARRMRDERDDAAPFGFATRVVALAIAGQRCTASLMDRFAWRALGIACLVALGSVAMNYRELAPLTRPAPAVVVNEDFDTISHDDPLAIVLDLAD